MNTEAILFIGNLVQNKLIKKINFKKKIFKVIWKNGSQARYDYTERGILEFLEDLDDKEIKN